MSKLNTPQPFPGLTYHHEPEADIIVWSNRRLPKNKALYVAFIAGLIISTPLAFFLTASLLKDVYNIPIGLSFSAVEILISLFFVFVSWIATIAILYYLLRLTWTESLKVSDKELSIFYSGILSPKEKRIPARDVWRLSFEKFGHERHQESRFTLNIFSNDKRETLAYWMRAEEGYQLYLLLAKIFEARDWPVKCKSDYEAK